MPAKAKATLASPVRHHLRLVQLVPDGTPGAYVDPIMGKSWSRSRKGLNGRGGFVSVEENPVLGDQSDFTVTLPPVGSDGVSQNDRFYYRAGTISRPGLPLAWDPLLPWNPGLLWANPQASRTGYGPGDEVIEVYRGRNELVASGTPVTGQVGIDQVQFVCRDVLEWLKKSRETAGGFWCNSPRDMFEHYTRLWQTIAADDFADSVAQFPAVASGGSFRTTPDSRWRYIWADNGGGPGIARLVGSGAGIGAKLASTTTWLDSGANVDHGCWRAEVNIAAAVLSASAATIGLTVDNVSTGHIVAQLIIAAQAGGVFAYTLPTGGTLTSWPTNVTGLINTTGRLSPPYTLAIERRDRWMLFYLDGQLIGVGAVPTLAPNTALSVSVSASNLQAGDYVAVDYVVDRRTTRPLNGGDPGDYVLPSPPSPGGLWGEYFDTSSLVSIAAGELTGGPSDSSIGARTDAGLGQFTTAFAPAWGYGLQGPFFVRWSGAIYLPLHTQDVHFTLPSPFIDVGQLRLWVGKTRIGEQILTNWSGDTPISSSPGLRSVLYPAGVPAYANGWYPLVMEYSWTPGGGANPAFRYDVGGAGTVPDQSVLAPLGCYRGQINGDSHYDVLRLLIEQFSYQWRGGPRQLESGSFPGVVIPRVNAGRVTDKKLTKTEAITPQSQSTAEDFASTLTASAQGIGGIASGNLTAELFDFEGMLFHAFCATEAENIPSTTDLGLLIQHMITLLGFRTSPWEDVQASTPGQREMRDSWPLTGNLAEFDWQPGDWLRLDLPEIGVVDVEPRQIIALRRMLYPDGIGEHQASFRPRPRDVYHTLRRFLKQFYGTRRTFQGQLVYEPSEAADAPNLSFSVLPADLRDVRAAELLVLAKQDNTTTFDIEINGTVQAAAGQVVYPGSYNLGGYVARNNGTEPRMVARLVNPSGACTVTYMLRVRTLLRSS